MNDDGFLMGSKGTERLSETFQPLEVMSGGGSKHWHPGAWEAGLRWVPLGEESPEGTEPGRRQWAGPTQGWPWSSDTLFLSSFTSLYNHFQNFFIIPS